MNGYAIFAVNEHMEFLLAEAAQRRAMRTDKPGILKRIASAASNARAALAMPLDNRGTILPALDDYPYRS